jgi:hypothetical protein
MLQGMFKAGDVVTVDFVEGKGVEFRRDGAASMKISQSASVG